MRTVRSLIGAIGASLALLGWALPAGAAGAEAGKVSFVRNATSDSANWLEAANRDASHRKWIRHHYSSVRGYAPYFTNQTFHDHPAWKPPNAQLYTNLYIMRQDEPARFRLMNAANPSQPVYIDASCSPGCPAYAGDTGDPAYRRWWIKRERKILNAGYKGIFIDDANMELRRFEDANGNTAFAQDPRTGKQMTQKRSRRYTAQFVEAINRAFPNEEIIANNNQFWIGNDKQGYNRRTIKASDVTELERGFSVGSTGGTDPYGYVTLLRHVEWIHRLGSSVLLEPYVTSSTAWKAELELASYFLIKARHDAIASTYRADRGNWWPGWETQLGKAKGGRSRWQGLFRRDFKRGMALVNQPGEPTRTVNLPGGTWRDLDGNTVTEVTLSAGTGKVLRKR